MVPCAHKSVHPNDVLISPAAFAAPTVVTDTDSVDSGVRRMNEVNPRRARLVPGRAGIPSRCVTSQLVN